MDVSLELSFGILEIFDIFIFLIYSVLSLCDLLLIFNHFILLQFGRSRHVLHSFIVFLELLL